MWIGNASGAQFFSANRWTVSFFNETRDVGTSAFPMRPLRELAVERRGAADPQKLGDIYISYLGLENVRPLTGELIDFQPKPALAIKSRSKIFRTDDVLYGRLRPELNKVFLAQGPLTEGLCSGEFIVFVPRTDLVLPRYLRHALASSFVTQFVSKFTVGASLPRITTADLLGINIPVPPVSIQVQMVKKLAEVDFEIAELRSRLQKLPIKQTHAFLESVSSGSGTIDIED